MEININTLRKTKGIGSKTLDRIIEQYILDNNLKAYKSTYKPSETYKTDKDINLWQGDCLELMEHIPDKSIDMILCDLRYGTTACSWDTVIPFEPLWDNYKRIIKDNGAIVLFGSEPFSTKLRMSNFNWYKYDWVWNKKSVSNPQNANIMPLKNFENISVFGESRIQYKPQGLIKLDKPKFVEGKGRTAGEALKQITRNDYVQTHTNYPKMILEFSRDGEIYHPTQKPVKLLEYLVRTYSNERELILDNTMGSGSTGVACKNTNRKFIGIELDEEYFNIAEERINDGI